jgi:surface carbohydrate biosynthesis protein
VNVYLQMEIKARELEGRTLLALAAAERGHHVLLGDLRRYLELATETFPAGMFHDKSLTPSARKLRLHARLIGRGFAVTSQDEEHWLNIDSYDVPASKRFSSASLANASRSFAWGPHELDALTAAYPEHADRLVATGSPRIDLWRPAFAEAHGAVELAGTEGRRGFVLFASNFVPALEVTRFWARMRDKRQHYVGSEDPYEFARYDIVADRFRVLGPFVRTVRRVAAAHPDTLVVVRPHPVEARGALTDLIGPLPNVLVTRQGALTPWVRRAAVLVQSDSTSGYEAAVVGTPVVSLTPDGVLAGSVVNRLGRRADDVDQAAALVAEALALDDRGRSAWLPTDGRALLDRRISALDGPLATDRIVDEWDRIAVPGQPWDLGRVRSAQRRVRARHRVGTLRARLRAGADGGPGDDAGPGPSTAARMASERSTDPFIGTHKFPPLSRVEVAGVVEGLQRALGRFRAVRFEVIGPDLIAFGPLGPRTGRARG